MDIDRSRRRDRPGDRGPTRDAGRAGDRPSGIAGRRGKNVSTLSDEEVDRVAAALAGRGQKISAIASPIGKIGIGDDFAPHLATFQRVLEIAERLAAPYVRIFSFYIPAGDDPVNHRAAVLDRLHRIVDAAAGSSIELLHENEKGIYGDTPARCHDLLTAIDSPRLQAIWDPANFVQVGVRPFMDGYDLLRPHVAYVHVKDSRLGSGEIVPAGEGDGELPGDAARPAGVRFRRVLLAGAPPGPGRAVRRLQRTRALRRRGAGVDRAV